LSLLLLAFLILTSHATLVPSYHNEHRHAYGDRFVDCWIDVQSNSNDVKHHLDDFIYDEYSYAYEVAVLAARLPRSLISFCWFCTPSLWNGHCEWHTEW
jgi:hypothetical protein